MCQVHGRKEGGNWGDYSQKSVQFIMDMGEGKWIWGSSCVLYYKTLLPLHCYSKLSVG